MKYTVKRGTIHDQSQDITLYKVQFSLVTKYGPHITYTHISNKLVIFKHTILQLTKCVQRKKQILYHLYLKIRFCNIFYFI